MSLLVTILCLGGQQIFAGSNNLDFVCGICLNICFVAWFKLCTISIFVYQFVHTDRYQVYIGTCINFGSVKLGSPSVGLQFIFFVGNQMLWFVLLGVILCRLGLHL